MRRPYVNIPEPQRGIDPDSWAQKTITTRFITIARRIFDENEFSPQIKSRLQDLINDIPKSPIRIIDDPGVPDIDTWNKHLLQYVGQNWLQPPWFGVEHYYYRCILEATGYFQDGDGFGIDPFAFQKRTGLEISDQAIQQLMDMINTWSQIDSNLLENVKTLIYQDLWGNQADLSLWPAEGDGKPDYSDLLAAQPHILVDDSASLLDCISRIGNGQARLDILLDNAGFELVCDLALADYLLSEGLISAVRLHVKSHPTYVSDAMEKDVCFTIDFLRSSEHPATKKSGERLHTYLGNDRLHMQENFFWTSPFDGWKMPKSLREELSESALVISKGDANYRRLLGDRHWPFTTPFDDIVSYFPAPLLALRTLKSELACGLNQNLVEIVSAKDPKWLIDGRWGVVQFFDGE